MLYNDILVSFDLHYCFVPYNTNNWTVAIEVNLCSFIPYFNKNEALIMNAHAYTNEQIIYKMSTNLKKLQPLIVEHMAAKYG